MAVIWCGGREPRTSSLEFEYSICSKSYRSLFVPSTLDAISILIPLRANFDLFNLSSGRRSCHLTLKIQNTNAASLKILMHSLLLPLSRLSFQLSTTSKKLKVITSLVRYSFYSILSRFVFPLLEISNCQHLLRMKKIDSGVLGARSLSNSEQNRTCDRRQRCV
ncbi:hypothetical protein BDR03DRAFT_975416 [Suillus americanus]|nr:hypothetical protein BDR03DRAFT_975416 [Suillus americanus]